MPNGLFTVYVISVAYFNCDILKLILNVIFAMRWHTFC